MDYKVLYRKYRPKAFDDVFGQDYSMKILKNAITSDKIAHAYIFTGPRGTGKTSTAKIFAHAINCLNLQDGSPCGKCSCCTNEGNPDIIEIDAASNNGVDEIRELINNVKVAPSYSKYKVYIIDEVHMLSTSAFNALLLTLEEPPGNVVFILATTDIQNVPVTILSRCQRFDFKQISEDKIYDRLKYVCNEENIEATDEALKEIAYVSNGGLRDALSILDQLSATKNVISIDDVYSNFGTVSSIKIEELIESFISNDVAKIYDILNEFKNNGINYSVLVEKVINKLEKVALNIKMLKENRISFDTVYQLMFDLNNCLNSSNININPYVLIQVTFLKYLGLGNKIDTKIISQEITVDKKEVINKPKKEKNISQEIKYNGLSEKNVKIRVNNCFVDANKQFKTDLIEKWDEFKNYLVDNNKSLYSILVDSTVELASSKYVVLVVKSLSTSSLINEKLDLISQLFESVFKLSIKFVCLSSDSWKKEMDEFKNNKLNGIIYKYLDEEIVESKTEIKNDSEISNLANELFDESVVEYE